MNTLSDFASPASPAAANAGSPTLRKQYAYLVYRSLDCFSHLATGVSRQAPVFERQAQAYARLIHLLLRHAQALPDMTEVLPACEALNGLLFHCCLCHRDLYGQMLRLAIDSSFAEVAAAGPGNDGENGTLESMFARAVDSLCESRRPEPEPTPMRDILAVQVLELSGLLRADAHRRDQAA